MNYILCQTLRLPAVRHELFTPPIPSGLHSSLCLFSPEESLYTLHPGRTSCTKAHISPRTHPWVSLIPEHADNNTGAMLAQCLDFEYNWNLCNAVRLDNPTGLGAGVEHRSVLHAFLEGTESNAISERPLKKLYKLLNIHHNSN